MHGLYTDKFNATPSRMSRQSSVFNSMSDFYFSCFPRSTKHFKVGQEVVVMPQATGQNYFIPT